MRNKTAILLTCMLSVLCLAGCTGTSDKKEKQAEKTEGTSEAQEKNTAAGQGKALPIPIYFKGTDMEGNEVSSDIFEESKLTMINVWATYCSPCLNEMPELGELSDEYDAGDFQIIGVISDVQEGAEQETLDFAAELIEKTEADYPHLLLNESLYNAILDDVTAVPTTLFINKNGTILETIVGARDKEQWEKIIDELLEEL